MDSDDELNKRWKALNKRKDSKKKGDDFSSDEDDFSFNVETLDKDSDNEKEFLKIDKLLDSSDSDSLIISERIKEASYKKRNPPKHRVETPRLPIQKEEAIPRSKPSSSKRTFAETTSEPPQPINSEIDDCGSFITVEENQEVRRSKRTRMKPLQYWKNEVVEMKRFPSGVGSLLPIPVSVHRAETPSEIPSTESTHPPIIETPEQEEITKVDDSLCIESPPRVSSSTDVTEFGTIFLYDKILEDASLSDERLVSTYKCECQLVGHNNHLPLHALYPNSPAIQGGASLEAESLFISGVFVVPAKCEKAMENCGDNCLIGVVLECEKNTVLVRINEKEFHLQRSDVFWVPKMNEYSVRNESVSQDARFVFINIKSDF